MAVRIAHASIDERGKISGGASGDQNGKECYIRSYYKSTWHTVLRPKNAYLANVSAAAAEFLANGSYVGYDQNQRNTLHSELRKLNYNYRFLKTKCETDCSAFVTACALIGGATGLEYASNAPATSNMVAKFKASGDYYVLTDKMYTQSSDYLKRGDILVKNGHTVIVLDDGIHPIATTCKAKVVTSGATLMLRQKPVSGTVISKMPKDATVFILGDFEIHDGVKWFYVKYTDKGIVKKGWASGNYLNILVL